MNALVIFTAVASFGLLLWRTAGVRDRLVGDERGEVTEKVILTALFAALALTAATIITMKVTDKANSIPTEPPAQQGGGLGE